VNCKQNAKKKGEKNGRKKGEERKRKKKAREDRSRDVLEYIDNVRKDCF
jgi:hypothetical protein